MKSIESILNCLQPKKKALIIGAAFVDVIVHVENLPRSGDDVQGKFEATTVGGCAFNAADVLHKLALPFDLMIPVGCGPYAQLVRAAMRKNNYSIVETKDEFDNGWCISLVEPSGERTFISVPGIETKMKREWFDDFTIGTYDYFYVSGYEAEGDNGFVLLDVLRKKKAGSKIIFDPGPRSPFIHPAVMQGFLALGVIFSINRGEALTLTGEKTMEDAGRKLCAWTSHPAIITDGDNGAIVAGQEIVRIPGFKVNVVDTIGAGDAHTGGILAGLLCDLTLAESAYLANRIASYVVGQHGAASAPTLPELQNR